MIGAIDLGAVKSTLAAKLEAGTPEGEIYARLCTTAEELEAVIKGRAPSPALAEALAYVATFEDLPASHRLEVDRVQTARFASSLFRHASPAYFVSLRGFHDAEPKRPFSIQAVPADAGMPHVAAELAQRCADAGNPVVFCPPIATFKTADNAKAVNLAEGLALSVEIDRDPAAARQRLEALLGPANVVVASGGEWVHPDTGEIFDKLHMHWRLAVPTRDADAHATLKQARKLATQLAGADASNVPLVHPIRWPGSWHTKRSPRLCRIVAENAETQINLADALAALSAAAGTATALAPDNRKPIGEPPSPNALAAIKSALHTLGNKTASYDEWMRRVAAIKAALGGLEEHYPIYEEWCLAWPSNTPELARAKWDSVTHSSLGANYIFDAARSEAGWNNAPYEFTAVATEPAKTAEAAPHRRFTVRMFSDIAPDPNRSWVIEELIPHAGLVLLCAKPNQAKTFNAIDQGMAVARGVPWHGRQTERGAVLYVSTEGTLGARIAAYRKHYSLEGQSLPFGAIEDGVNLYDGRADVAPLIAEGKALADATGLPLRLVFVDTLANALANGDENAGKDIGAVLTNVARIQRETGAAVTLVHHLGKDAGRGARGHSSLVGRADAIFEINDCVLTVEKLRDAEKGARFGFTLLPVPVGVSSKGRPVTSCVVLPASVSAQEDFGEKYIRPGSMAGQALTVWQDLTMGQKQPALAEEQWRDEFIRRHYPENKRSGLKAFSRAVTALKSARPAGLGMSPKCLHPRAP